MSKKVIDSLVKLIANNFILYLKTQNFHWNVKGPHFNELHAMFQHQYEDLALANDAIAERIRAIGAEAPANFTIYEKHRVIKDGNEKSTWKHIIKELHDDQIIMIKILKSTAEVAQMEKDETTFDLMVQRQHVHEKNAWMLKSIAE